MKSERCYDASLRHWKRSQRFLVPGTSTISKHPKLMTFGAYPIYAQRAKGALITDLDGHSYIDFISALGAIILGHAHPAVSAAVQTQLSAGTLFSLANPRQAELAELICTLIPGIERVRLCKNGSDATSIAARLARAATGRSKLAVCHYHGWHDWYYVNTPQRLGIPGSFQREVFSFPYNDLKAVEQLIAQQGGEIAAFMLEPIHLDAPQAGFLQKLAELVHRNGSLLIFDEVVTGFRFDVGGAQQYFGVFPDLTCLAKALGNGLPIAAVGGRADLMKSTEDVVASMTYGEEALSIAGAIATLHELSDSGVTKRIWSLGAQFQKSFNELSQQRGLPLNCVGLPPRLAIQFTDSARGGRLLLKSYFLEATARRGVLFGQTLFISGSHTEEHIDFALGVCSEVFDELQGLDSITPELLKGAVAVELW